MESPISIRDTEIPLQMQNIIDASTASYIKSLHSLRATAQETARCQDLRVLTPNPNPVHPISYDIEVSFLFCQFLVYRGFFFTSSDKDMKIPSLHIIIIITIFHIATI